MTVQKFLLPVQSCTPLALTAMILTGTAGLSGCSGEKPTPPPQAARPVPPAVTMEKPVVADEADHDHDHDHDHELELPKTIEEAISGLKEVGVKVEKALTGGNTEKADDLVHSVGHLIEDLQEKIAAAKLGEKAKAAAKAAADEIYDAYDAIDETLHAAEEEVKKLDFKQFAPKIEAATKQLEDMFVKAKQTLVGEQPTGNEPKAETKPDPKPEPKAENKTPPKPEMKADATPEPKAEAKPEPKAESKPEPKAESKPEPKAEPEAETKPAPAPEPKPAEKPATEAPAGPVSDSE